MPLLIIFVVSLLVLQLMDWFTPWLLIALVNSVQLWLEQHAWQVLATLGVLFAGAWIYDAARTRILETRRQRWLASPEYQAYQAQEAARAQQREEEARRWRQMLEIDYRKLTRQQPASEAGGGGGGPYVNTMYPETMDEVSVTPSNIHRVGYDSDN